MVLNKIERRVRKLTITRGKHHTFLRMDIDFIGNAKVKIAMVQYILECIEAYKLSDKETAATPVKSDLFMIDDKSLRLTESETEQLHSIVAKLLHISNRVRPDILLTVTFLCTRVQKPTKQDTNKLRHVLLYLNGTGNYTDTLTTTSKFDDVNIITYF